MNHHELPSRFIVLTLVGHGGAEREHRQYGSPQESRFLNVTGRWASAGTEAVPLLSWPDLAAAEADAAKASSARRRQVLVSSVGGSQFGCFAPYGDQHAGALLGYLPYAATAARKLEAERQRFMGYVRVMLAGEAAQVNGDALDVVEAMKTAARNLRLAGFGNGSWVTAAQGLTGNRAHELLGQVIDGDLSCDPGMTQEDIRRAIGAAKTLVSRMPGRR